MKIRNKLDYIDLIVYTITIIIMVSSFAMVVRDAAVIKFGLHMMIYYCIIALLPIIIMRNQIKYAFTIILLIITAFVLYLIKIGYHVIIMSYTVGFFKWLLKYLTCNSYFDYHYTNAFMFAFIAVATLVLSILVLFMGKRAKTFIIIIGTACMTYFWLTYVEKAKVYLIYFLFGALNCYSYQYYKTLSQSWQDRSMLNMKHGNIQWIINSFMIISMALTLAFAIPLNIKPVTWNWLNSLTTDVFPFIAEWRNDALDSYGYGYNSRYNMKSMGYNEKSLGGPIALNNAEMFEIDGAKQTDPLYIKGVIKDKYSGAAWSKSQTSYKTFGADDYSRNPYSSNVITNTISMEIIPKNIITSTILYPFSIYKATYKNNRYFIDTDGEAYFSKLVRRGDKYKVESIMPTAVRDRELVFEDYFKRDKRYMELPNNISSRVRRLSISITSGRRNDFDKVKAIESYLRNNYKYTLSPSKVPEGREFVDYFLFEGKEGYCTYFATSMAVLLRASSIPCRYVEGFIVTDKCWNDNGYSVKGENAHAWVEVYFKNYGWMQLEPTPAYEVEELELFRVNNEAQNEELVETTEVDSTVHAISPPRRKELIEDDGEIKNNNTYKPRNSVKTYVGYAFLLILVIMIIRTIIINFKNAKTNKDIRLVCEMLWYFKIIGIDKKENQTIRSFFIGISRHGSGFYVTERIIYLFEKLLYSGENLTTAEKDEVESFISSIRNITIKRVGKIKYAYILIVLGKQYCQMI